MPENKYPPLPPLRRFLVHVLQSLAIGALLIIIALFIGMCGYRGYENMSWVDAFVNASMILSGMGPVSSLNTEAGKIFAGCYALFSGLFFILIMGIVFAPVIHRFLHQFHLKLNKS